MRCRYIDPLILRAVELSDVLGGPASSPASLESSCTCTQYIHWPQKRLLYMYVLRSVLGRRMDPYDFNLRFALLMTFSVRKV